MAFPVPNLLFLLDHHSQQYSPFGLEFSILYPKTEYYFALLVISVVLIKMACDFFFLRRVHSLLLTKFCLIFPSSRQNS